jgi:hypothetical protein
MAGPGFEVISVALAADGWRAVFSGSGGPFVHPLVCWGVFRKTAAGAPAENVVAGVLAERQPGGRVRSLFCAEEAEHFDGYLAPDEPDPPPAKRITCTS